MNFLNFFWILFDFFINFISLFKKANKGFYLHRTRGADMVHGDPCRCDIARKATWQRRADPCAEVAQTRGKGSRVHANARVAPRDGVRGLRVIGPRVSGPR